MSINKLTASRDKWLTNGEAYAKTVFLGVNCNSSDWYEITDEEKNKMFPQEEEEEEEL